MKDIPIADMTIERLRVEYETLRCIAKMQEKQIESTEGLLENYADTEVEQEALIVQLKHDLNQANHREAAAMKEANDCRQMLLILQQQQISE